MRRVALSVSLAVGMTCLVSAQQQQPPIKTITTGVVVDVTVIDSKGNPILDLVPADFEISEDGVRQTIISASLVHNGFIQAVNATRSVSGESAGQKPEPSSAGSAPRTAVTPSVTAILFDRLSPESRDLARRAALAYVSTLSAPHDYAAVFLADLSLRTFQSFTNQRDELARAVDVVSATAPANMSAAAEPESKRVLGLDPSLSPTEGAESAGGGFGGIAEREHRLNELRKLSQPDPSEWMMLQMESRMREGYQRILAEMSGQASLAGLRAVVSGFGELPGRKSILYFTESLSITDRLKPKFDSLIGEANRANIVVYPVDAVGLRVQSKELELGRNVAVAGAKGIGDEERERGAWTKDLEKQNELLMSRPGAVLGRLAKDTGGFLLENTNDLSAGVARMQRERTTYYLLAYQPTNTKLDGTFRKISVKVKRSKTTVRARPGYVAPTANETGK
jgi:VWFA-related protein